MRLAALTLERYGPFARLHLPLDPAPGRINLIVAPNGHGKSVIRHAIRDFLFDIPERTPMAFRHGTEQMRLLAELAGPAGTRSLVRRKGRGNTLAEADGTPVAPDEASALLGGAGKALFEELFGLDTTLLRQGGQALIDSQGRLGQVLFAAGGGMGRVRALLDRLGQARDGIGRPQTRHKSRPLWAALTAMEAAQAELNRAALRPDGWRALEREAAEARERLAALRRERAELAGALERLRTIRAARPWLARHAEARAVLEAAGDVPLVEDAFERRWRDALAAGAQTASAATSAAAALDAARAARAAIAVDPAWLAARDAIVALSELRGRAEGARTDLPGVAAALAEATARGDRLRRDLGWDDAVEVPPAPAVRGALQHLRARPKLAAACEAAERDEAEAARALDGTRAALAALPPVADTAGLAELTAALRAGGDPAAQIDRAQRRLRETEAALAAALAAIPDRMLSEAGLDATAAPSDPALEAAETALSAAAAAHAQARRDLDALAADLARKEADLARLSRASALPEPGRLEATRAHRDRLWMQLAPARDGAPFERARDGAPFERARDGAPFESARDDAPFDPAPWLGFDRALREADAVADALIAHSAEAAKAATLRDGIAETRRKQASADMAAAEAAERLSRSRAHLAAIARAAGADAGAAPPALRAFLRARLLASARKGERDRAAADAADLRAQLAAIGAQLARALGEEPAAPETLGALLAAAEERIAAARRVADRRAALEQEAARKSETRAARRDAAAAARVALAAWEARWAETARALARPPGEAAETAGEALALIEELRQAEARRDAEARRVADMRASVARLAEPVAALAGRLAPDLAALPPIETSLRLEARLREEREADARRAELDARLDHAARAAEAARDAAGEAARALAALRTALRAEDDEAAERQIRRARAVADAVRTRGEAEAALAAEGGGLGLPALATLAAATTPEADAAEIDRLAARAAELAPRIEAEAAAATRAEEARNRAGEGTDAADAAARRAAAQAALARNAEEALLLHAASALLQAALERQAAAADRPLLARIGSVFRAITGGVHAGVAIEAHERGPSMVALDADGVARKPLDQLSEGTRDQLYLALRIAALEDYAAAAPPLPFVADDVLQTFDDGRTVAALEALLALSERVQVIALTHHPHVARLAAALPTGAVQCVELGGEG